MIPKLFLIIITSGFLVLHAVRIISFMFEYDRRNGNPPFTFRGRGPNWAPLDFQLWTVAVALLGTELAILGLRAPFLSF